MNEERHWIITFSNGYCSCDQEEEFIGTYEGAIDYANERLRKRAENISNVVFDWDEKINEDEFEEYCDNCDYDIEEREGEDED